MTTLSIATIVLAAATSLGSRSQRFHRELAFAGDQLDQVEQTGALLAVELRAIAPGEGDIPQGEARDTSLQFRTTIGTSIVCESMPDRLVLAPQLPAPRLASYLTPPVSGDTVWTLSRDTAGSLGWSSRAIVSVSSSPGRCILDGTDVHGSGPASARVVLGLEHREGVEPAGAGAPLRITRPARYSLYRASDGRWYLGLKEWNAGAVRFNAIQPVSGPFLSASRGGLVFRYRDSLGAPVVSGAPDTHRIALIEIAVQADSAAPGRWFGLGAGSTRTAFSLALRNRAR